MKLNILLAGAGFMGRRHLHSLLNHPDIEKVYVTDSFPAVFDIVRNEFTADELSRITFLNEGLQADIKGKTDAALISTSAQNRGLLIQEVIDLGIKNILVEKPVEQSYKKVLQVVEVAKKNDAKVFVNFTRRAYAAYLELFRFISSTDQFKGKMEFIISGGALGIGCNGSHLIDLCLWLSGAENFEILGAGINDTLVTSGRGKNYADFGGWIDVKLLDKNNAECGNICARLSSESTAPHGITILGTHARIDLDEIHKQYTFTLRKPDSQLPLHRYASDYNQPETVNYNLENWDIAVNEWVKSIRGQQKILLPFLADSLLVHRLVFDWLNYSKEFKDEFPIT